MSCHCNSHTLYQTDYTNPGATFTVDSKQYKTQRSILTSEADHLQNLTNLQKLQQNPAYLSIIESSQLWLPSGQIDIIRWDEIEFNPVWFYRNYLSKNVPCVITDVYEGDDIFDRWNDPSYMQQAMDGYKGISMSLTPDGFADSVKGDFFIEPEEVKTDIKSFLQYKQTFPNAIPYIQHQNSSLSEEMWMLHAQVDQDPLKFLSNQFFNGASPDAENFWMGFDQSVSSMHKDPYENFYTTISGQKHFTLLPPVDALFLEQREFKKAKWSYNKEKGDFTCNQTKQESTRWLACNVDLEDDMKNTKAFPWLSRVHKFHVTLKKGETLFLPSLWYHQVSQSSGKDPYTVAINYWFDMQFGQNYSLYEVCRKLRGI